MFKKLFQNIWTDQADSITNIYNECGTALAIGDQLDKAIAIFKQICEQHPSAAYNLGLIYLDGVGKITPNYRLARKYFQLAHNLGHSKAEVSARIIGLNGEKKLSVEEQQELFVFAVMQYATANQFGNLAYLIAYDIKRNILETSTDELYSLDRFLSYELYCLRNYGSDEVLALYETSSLVDLPINYLDDWESGNTAKISDYINEKVLLSINLVADFLGEKVNFTEMGTLRVAVVNAVYEYYLDVI